MQVEADELHDPDAVEAAVRAALRRCDGESLARLREPIAERFAAQCAAGEDPGLAARWWEVSALAWRAIDDWEGVTIAPLDKLTAALAWFVLQSGGDAFVMSAIRRLPETHQDAIASLFAMVGEGIRDGVAEAIVSRLRDASHRELVARALARSPLPPLPKFTLYHTSLEAMFALRNGVVESGRYWCGARAWFGRVWCWSASSGPATAGCAWCDPARAEAPSGSTRRGVCWSCIEAFGACLRGDGDPGLRPCGAAGGLGGNVGRGECHFCAPGNGLRRSRHLFASRGGDLLCEHCVASVAADLRESPWALYGECMARPFIGQWPPQTVPPPPRRRTARRGNRRARPALRRPDDE